MGLTVGTTAVVVMLTERTPNGIDYSVWIEYQSEDCETDRKEVWHEKLSFDGSRRDLPRARILAREQEKRAMEAHRKAVGLGFMKDVDE
jgi:hypothetical protein